MTTDTNQESEMTPEELAAATGGARNLDNPIVRTALNAFNQSLKEGEAARRAANVELMRNQGGLGSTKQL